MIKIVVAAIAATLRGTQRAIATVAVHAIVIVVAHVVVTADQLKDAVKKKGG